MFFLKHLKKFPLLLPSHNCIIITMFSFQGAAWIPLRNSMKSHLSMGFQSIPYLGWWRLAGSNRWPPACKAGALPAELNPHIPYSKYQLKAQRSGFQLERRSRFSVKYWSLLQYELRKASFDEVVGQNGLEPSTSRLSVVCSSQLSYWPILDFFTS